MTIVTPIRPGTTISPIKQQFLDYVAQTFDSWVEEYGTEPTGIVYGFGDLKGNASAHWNLPNTEPGNECKMLIISIAHQIAESVAGR